jgi:hypothetical protein
MRDPPDLVPVDDEQLETSIPVMLAVDGRMAPLLYGKGASRNPSERDHARLAFARWLVDGLKKRGLCVYSTATAPPWPTTPGPVDGGR